MVWLTFDTACPRGAIGVIRNGVIEYELYLKNDKRHSEILLKSIFYCIKKCRLKIEDVNGIAVGRGPGSFIGSRISMSVAKGISLSRNIPLVGLCTLSAIAVSFESKHGKILSALSVSKNELCVKKVNTIKRGHIFEIKKSFPETIMCSDLLKFENFDYVLGFGVSGVPEKKKITAMGPTVFGLRNVLLDVLSKSKKMENEAILLAPEYIKSFSLNI